MIDRNKKKDESIFDFYLRFGGRLGHDPNPEFSELLYRRFHPDVYSDLLKNKDGWGYRHYVAYGRAEADRRLPTRAEIEAVRRIVVHLDPQFLSAEYDISPEEYVSPFDFYFSQVRDLKVSPSSAFCEASYRELNADVDEEIRSGTLHSGFAHFVHTVKKEKRKYQTVDEYEQKLRRDELEAKKKVLEENLPGITHTYAFDVIRMIEFFTKDIDIVFETSEQPCMIVLVPNFLPEILFGGYLAFFEFLHALKEASGIELRLVVFNEASEDKNKWNAMRMRLYGDHRANIFSSIEYMAETRQLHIPLGSKVISYCAETHYPAHFIAERLQTIPFFFIQEFEPHFHANGDTFTFSCNAFALPHYGVYNSSVLRDYFLNEGGMRRIHGRTYRYCSFENHINRIAISKAEFEEKNKDKKIRRLVFYGRPEQHATRNQFATFAMGLREAIGRDYFKGGAWDFVSIGSLVHEGQFPLTDGCKLRIVTKMPVGDYIDFLQMGDIGVSFISTPHPGIVHFQMANYGLVTLTNTTGNRSAEWISAQSGNLVPVDLTPASIAEGLRVAVQRSLDLDARYENARDAPYLSRSECLQPALDAVLAELDLPHSRTPERSAPANSSATTLVFPGAEDRLETPKAAANG
ncbi:MAG: hypothetical protein C3F11_04975 [Methylocystaceae bacterium]|nr:MAG: hypothetical protein C3F11_04975 [Methylocystaceae bacterium]